MARDDIGWEDWQADVTSTSPPESKPNPTSEGGLGNGMSLLVVGKCCVTLCYPGFLTLKFSARSHWLASKRGKQRKSNDHQKSLPTADNAMR